MKKLITTAFFLFTMTGISISLAAAEQATYKVSVTIPAIVGVNIDADTEEHATQPADKNSPMEVIKEKIMEATGMTVLVSLVER